MDKLKNYLVPILFAFLAINSVMAQTSNFIVCNGPNCTLCDLLVLAKNVISFITQLTLVLAGAFFAWGAIVMMTARDSEQQVSSGKKIMTISVWGCVLSLGAWVIVATLLQIITGSTSKLPWDQIQCTF